MARGSVNKVILIGHLGADPELKYTPSGRAVANFNMATTDAWTDKTSGEKKEKTEWHRIVVWDKQAEICGEYLKKGSHVYIEGRLQTRSWEDKNGLKRYTTEIVAQRMQMLGAKGTAPAEVETPPAEEEAPEGEKENLPF